MAKVTKASSKLPKIIYFLDTLDSGAFGEATCPHCGALGRYVYRFVCEDGETRGAMAGCVKLYPMHRFAKLGMQIMDRQREYATKGWLLASWDCEILDAIHDYAIGKIPEAAADELIFKAQTRRDNWRAKKKRSY